MNIFIREMKVLIKSLILWCIASFFLIVSGMAKFSGTSVSNESMNELISKMPKSLLSIMGIGSFDLSKASGYYSVLFFYLVLMAAIHSAMIGANIISKEERDKTAEFIFVKPVSRSKIITEKLIAAFIIILILNIFISVSSILIVNYFNNGENLNEGILNLMIGLFILQLLFLFIGTAISAINKKPRTSISISTGILLIMFILSVVIDIDSNLDFLKYLTPFKYFEAKNLMYGGQFDIIFITLSIFIIIVCGIITYAFYNKKDLNI
ncbi:ABC transporter permease subunit [Clostridium sp. HBUAS56017]|uniref:ABC transporter permease subunit n=1 Tax=Clostridium sp. HBUAS56017 TaxID=2571128 RepID=UPI0011777A03|nr:ABC transporter permease subunit [Clostridium sp. HBUAS56017]